MRGKEAICYGQQFPPHSGSHTAAQPQTSVAILCQCHPQHNRPRKKKNCPLYIILVPLKWPSLGKGKVRVERLGCWLQGHNIRQGIGMQNIWVWSWKGPSAFNHFPFHNSLVRPRLFIPTTSDAWEFIPSVLRITQLTTQHNILENQNPQLHNSKLAFFHV